MVSYPNLLGSRYSWLKIDVYFATLVTIISKYKIDKINMYICNLKLVIKLKLFNFI